MSFRSTVERQQGVPHCFLSRWIWSDRTLHFDTFRTSASYTGRHRGTRGWIVRAAHLYAIDMARSCRAASAPWSGSSEAISTAISRASRSSSADVMIISPSLLPQPVHFGPSSQEAELPKSLVPPLLHDFTKSSRFIFCSRKCKSSASHKGLDGNSSQRRLWRVRDVSGE